MHSLFVSDLHLSPDRPGLHTVFLDFLRGPAAQAEALYILGDLFEYWAGDDDNDPFNAGVLAALRTLATGGTPVYVMHGNRDFLFGERFAGDSGATLIPDPTVVNLYGTQTLLMHGDTLCTDDVAYQQFRVQVRDPRYQQQFLSRPLADRKQFIAGLRDTSAKEKSLKSEEIMDVAPAAVETVLREHDYPRLIHGHTHRPARHEHVVDGHRCERWVLGDWYQRGSYLYCDGMNCRSVLLPEASPTG